MPMIFGVALNQKMNWKRAIQNGRVGTAEISLHEFQTQVPRVVGNVREY